MNRKPDERAKKAFELGFKYEQDYGGCAQCTMAAVQNVLKSRNDDVFKAATGLVGGIGLVGKGTCGALIGGGLALGYRFGREYSNFADPKGTRYIACELVAQLYDRFLEEYGSGSCHDIQTKLFGRAYTLRDKKELEEFKKDGGHKDKCPTVVGKSAQWTVEMILEEEKKRKAKKAKKGKRART